MSTCGRVREDVEFWGNANGRSWCRAVTWLDVHGRGVTWQDINGGLGKEPGLKLQRWKLFI
jgi:hypothetical protein